MNFVKRVSGWLQYNQDIYLAFSANLYLLVWLNFEHLQAVKIIGLLNLVFLSGLILYGKRSSQNTTRIADTQRAWSVVLASSLGSLLLSIEWTHLAGHLLIINTLLSLVACVIDKHIRFQLAKKRIEKRRLQQSKWRRSKQTVLAEWKARLRWLAGVQHDIRQPLNALGLLLQNPKLQSGQADRELVDRMLSCQRWLKELAENTIEASRLELREHREIRVENISAKSLCSSLGDWLAHLAKAKGLGFSIEAADNLICTDVSRLKRVLGNLLFNAVEHSYEGNVSLRYRRKGGVHQFILSDDGPGVSVSLVNSGASNDSFGSDLPKTGIGLYVVRRLCQEMAWNLSVTNHIHGGTSFILELGDHLATSLCKSPEEDTVTTA